MTDQQAKPGHPMQADQQPAPPSVSRLLAWCVAALCLAAVALALISQYRFGMQPCPWCTLQRLLFLLLAAAATVCALGPDRWWGRLAAGVAFLFSVAGAASALWQHLVASRSGSCGLTLADRVLDGLGLFRLLPSVFEPKASCAEAAVHLLGLPYEWWSLGLFVISGGLMVAVVLKRSSSRAAA